MGDIFSYFICLFIYFFSEIKFDISFKLPSGKNQKKNVSKGLKSKIANVWKT